MEDETRERVSIPAEPTVVGADPGETDSMAAPEEDSDDICPLCRVRLKHRRRVLAFSVFLGVWLLALFDSVGRAVLEGRIDPFIILAGELALFFALGAGNVLLEEWAICPICAAFRLPHVAYRRLTRIEWVFKRLSIWLVVPGGFFIILGLTGIGRRGGAGDLGFGFTLLFSSYLAIYIALRFRPQNRLKRESWISEFLFDDRDRQDT